MPNKINNGGAIAIKGFNYQKASIILIMINNYQREDFLIIPEAEDDFQVYVNGKTIFIQVKGEKNITLQKLISKEIIKKNLIPGHDEDIRKIFVWDIDKKFQNSLKEIVSGNIISPLLNYSDQDLKRISDNLNLNENQQIRLKNQYIYKTPFNNNLTEAIKRLFGELVSQNLQINNESGRALLSELSLMIDQKSEIIVLDNNYSLKTIDNVYLKKVFARVEQHQEFDRILDKLSYNEFKKRRIKQEKTKILVSYQNIKKKTKNYCNNLNLEQSTEQELINQIVQIIKNHDSSITNDNLIIAIAIECLCELWEDALC